MDRKTRVNAGEKKKLFLINIFKNQRNNRILEKKVIFLFGSHDMTRVKKKIFLRNILKKRKKKLFFYFGCEKKKRLEGTKTVFVRMHTNGCSFFYFY